MGLSSSVFFSSPLGLGLAYFQLKSKFRLNYACYILNTYLLDHNDNKVTVLELVVLASLFIRIHNLSVSNKLLAFGRHVVLFLNLLLQIGNLHIDNCLIRFLFFCLQ